MKKKPSIDERLVNLDKRLKRLHRTLTSARARQKRTDLDKLMKEIKAGTIKLERLVRANARRAAARLGKQKKAKQT